MKLSKLAKDLNLRFDAKAVALFFKSDAINNQLIPLQVIAEVREIAPCDKPTEPFAYHEISSVSEFGTGEPYWIDETNIEQGSEEERILAKVNKGDIAMPQQGSILIPKVRPHLGKFVLVKDRNEVFYTNAFFEACPRGISIQLLYCILKHPLTLKQISRISTIGKGYPTISPFDLTRFVKVPSILLAVGPEVDRAICCELDRLLELIPGLRKEREIIDAVFEELITYEEPEAKKSFICSRSKMDGSFNLRMSAHFVHPPFVDLLEHLWHLNTVKIKRLCALPISLGVSPELYLNESEYYYLGPQAMSGEKLNTEKLGMISREYYKAMEPRFGVQVGDVFLRRSGASLGKVLYFDSDLPCIFSDFMMRIRFHNSIIAKYAAYWMRSTLFQQLTKTIAVIGKGLQNIYPHQVELMPIPNPEKYDFKEIVASVEKEITKNDQIQSKVQEKMTNLEKRLSQDLNFAILEQFAD